MAEIVPGECAEPTVLVNLMPPGVLEKTERQWRDRLGVDVVVRLDDDPRLAAERPSAQYVAGCPPFSEIAAGGIRRIVISGANKELVSPTNPDSPLKPLDDIDWIDQVRDILDYAEREDIDVVASCLAAMIDLDRRFGAERERFDTKLLGTFEHEVFERDHSLMEGMGRTVNAPHSRWGTIPTKVLEDCGVTIIAAHEDAGTLVGTYGNMTYLLAHPEYDAEDPWNEYMRDKAQGQSPPEGYGPDGTPIHQWADDAQTLFANIRQGSMVVVA